jgi:predicted DNA-binding transcriptional regulator AlpA
MKRVGTHCNRDDRRWLRVAEVAQTLSVSPRLVYKMIDNGDLPAVQVEPCEFPWMRFVNG